MKTKILIITLFISILVACKAKQEQSLNIGYIPIAECAQLYVAQQLGLFEKYHIKVNMIPLAGGAKILNALNSKDVDVGFTNVLSLIMHKSQGSDFYSIFGGTYETPSNQNHALLITGKNKSLSADDFKKGTILALNTNKNIEELMCKKYFKSKGINWDDIRTIEVDFPKMLPMLESGQIDICSIVEPFITISSGNPKISRLDNQYLATTKQCLVATYASSNEIIGKKKQALLKFIQAMDEATDFINNNETQARNIIGNYTKIPTELLSRIGLSKFEKNIKEDDIIALLESMKEYKYISMEANVSAKAIIWNE